MTSPTAPEDAGPAAESPRPIGYWLKAADEALTGAIDAAQREHGVNRLEWQALHAIAHAGRLDLSHLLHRLLPLGPMDRIAEALDRFVDEGWLDAGVDGPHQIKFYEITRSGQERHGVLLQRQEEVRRAAMDGIRPEEYATVVHVLARLVQNLGANSAAP